MELAPAACQEAGRLHNDRTPAYFFTASGNGRRVNGVVPFGKLPKISFRGQAISTPLVRFSAIG